MSKPVRKITIAGFRGIPGTFELNFKKGNSIRSLVLYGRNGTGKSTITDACEWFHSGRIDGLGRRGAGEGAYSHRDPIAENTFVKFTFEGDLEDATLTLKRSAPTTDPDTTGDIDGFRELAQHPFYIRFADLKNFVFETQAKKYDQLADLMGFKPQVDFQEALKRVSRRFERAVEQQNEKVGQRKQDLRNHLDATSTSDEALIASAEEIFDRQELETPSSIDNIHHAKTTLSDRVENDPTANEISALSTLLNQLDSLNALQAFQPDVATFLTDLDDFAAQQTGTVNTLLLKVYESGKEYFDETFESGHAVETCPLCGEDYDGNLREHVDAELESLKALREAISGLQTKKASSLASVRKAKRDVSNIRQFDAEVDVTSITNTFGDFQDDLRDLERRLEKLIDSLEAVAFEDANHHAREIRTKVESVTSVVDDVSANSHALVETVKARKEKLSQNESKRLLAGDYSWLDKALEKRGALLSAKKRHSALMGAQKSFTNAVDSYVASNSKNVEQRFSEISGDVKTFFEILERDTEGLGDPEIELTEGTTRGVYLKVHFYGEDERPAYKYLSESQLNSFGLAVFLASVKRFNSGFPFIVLDDVINSFDAYKRTKVIDLLKDELPDFQVLLLTHDDVWFERLTNYFPQWVRRRFKDWGYETGPLDGKKHAGLDRIEKVLDDDRGREAGSILGPFLEDKLQCICQDFKVKIPYNRRNTYTLNDFFQALQKRVKDKFSKGHDLYKAIGEAFTDRVFRNYCSHWKNPSTPYQTSEIREVVNTWKDIDAILRCDECGRYVSYDGSSFICPCDEHELTK